MSETGNMSEMEKMAAETAAAKTAEAIKEKKPAKPEVKINGQTYRLRFDLWALEQIEEEFGGVRDAFKKLLGPEMHQAVRKLFAITANCQRDYDGMPADVTPDTIGRHTSVAKLTQISEAIQAAVEIGMKSETDGGEADDEAHDALAEEYDEKNG